MGYEVKVTDIKEVRTAAINQISSWQGGLQMVDKACFDISNSLGMQGKAAESIKSYVKEVHGTLFGCICQMMREYQDRLLVYEAGYDGIDTSQQAHITQDTLEDLQNQIYTQKENFMELSEELHGIIDSIADIFITDVPSIELIITSYDNIKQRTASLNEAVGTYEEVHQKDCQGVLEQISSIRAFIESYKKNTAVTISSYRAGALLETKDFKNLKSAYANSANYYKDNKDKIKLAQEYMQAKIEKEIADKRLRKGKWDLVAAIGTVVIGTAAIILTGGAAAPLIIFTSVSTIAYGTSNGIEAIQDIKYGLAGDINSVAVNPIRDTVFLGSETAYDTWGTISTAISLSICFVGPQAANISIKGMKQGIATWLNSGTSNILKSTLSYGGKSLMV